MESTMTLKDALLHAQDVAHPGQVLLGTAGGFVLKGDIEGVINEDSEFVAFNLGPGQASGSVERANGSTIAIPSGRLLIPISSIAWISLERQRPSSTDTNDRKDTTQHGRPKSEVSAKTGRAEAVEGQRREPDEAGGHRRPAGDQGQNGSPQEKIAVGS
jgi:hypothetical protein